MSDQEFILAPPTVKVNFALAPVRNQLNNLSLLNQSNDLSGFSDWVLATWEAMSAERKRTNQMVLSVMLDWDKFSSAPDFETGVKRIRNTDPDTMWNGILDHICMKVEMSHDLTPADRERLRTDTAYYVEMVNQTIAVHYAEKGKQIDLSLYEDVHRMFDDPQRLIDTAVEHLGYMWDTYLKADWERNLPVLNESVNAFRQLDYRGQTAIETARFVTGRDLAGIFSALDTASNLTFVPSVHIGPYVIFHQGTDTDTNNYLVFGARVPEGVTKSTALGRSELLVRISALADDTRLKILELMTQHDEVCAQDIITWLDLSQSSASRHLRQLTATGYITERRRDVAKCYSLNRERIDDTLFALKHFLRM